MTDNCNTQQSERIPIILNWLGREGLKFTQALIDEEKRRVEEAWDCLRCLITSSNPNVIKQYCYYNTVN